MPYKDKNKQREYMRNWIAKRKAEFFLDKQCSECGSTENLELDHLDPSDKTEHRIWSWSKERREVELSKCQVLCNQCHHLKSLEEILPLVRGSVNYSAKLTEEQVLEIRLLVENGFRQTEVARMFGMSKSAINDIVRRRRWAWL